MLILNTIATELEARLREGLNQCQYIESLPGLFNASPSSSEASRYITDPMNLPPYATKGEKTDLRTDVIRETVRDQRENVSRYLQGLDMNDRGKAQPFWDLTRMMMDLGTRVDNGMNEYLIFDPPARLRPHSVILIRVRPVSSVASHSS